MEQWTGYGNGIMYTVRPGDTMYSIAKAHGIRLRTLIEANPQIPNPSLIMPGQQIFIPGATGGTAYGTTVGNIRLIKMQAGSQVPGAKAFAIMNYEENLIIVNAYDIPYPHELGGECFKIWIRKRDIEVYEFATMSDPDGAMWSGLLRPAGALGDYGALGLSAMPTLSATAPIGPGLFVLPLLGI